MSTVKHTPVTPLPWVSEFVSAHSRFFRVGNEVKVSAARISNRDDSAYIAHAANAYPKLVEALRDAAQEAYITPNNGERWDEGFKTGWDHALNLVHVKLAALLRELGEGP